MTVASFWAGTSSEVAVTTKLRGSTWTGRGGRGVGRITGLHWWEENHLTLSGALPTLALDYENNQYAKDTGLGLVETTFTDLHAYSGASLSTQRDNAGLMKLKPHSLLERSEDFNNAYWTKGATTVDSNATTAPDGTLTADKLKASVTITDNRQIRKDSVTLTADEFTVAIYGKAGEIGILRIFEGSTGGTRETYFNLNTGAVGTSHAAHTATMIPAGNDWYLCSVTFLAGTSSSNLGWGMSLVDNVNSYGGVQGEGLFIWGAQRNRHPMDDANDSYAPGYVPTVAAVVFQHRIDHKNDGAGFGLALEETRTNKIEGSGDISNATHWTNKELTSIALEDTYGLLKLYTTTENTETDVHGIFATAANRPIKASAGHSVACSVRLKAGTRRYLHLRVSAGDTMAVTVDTQTWTITEEAVDGAAVISDTSIELVDTANSIYQLTIVGVYSATATIVAISGAETGTPGSSGTSYEGDSSTLIFSGIQVEFNVTESSSYIPTTTVGVTRAEETLDLATADFDYNNEGANSFIMDVSDVGYGPTNMTYLQIHDGTFMEEIGIRRNGDHMLFLLDDGGVGQHNVSFTNGFISKTTTKMAFAFAVNSINEAQDGVAKTVDTSGSMPDVDTISIGRQGSGGARRINSHINSVIFYGVRLPDADLVAETT